MPEHIAPEPREGTDTADDARARSHGFRGRRDFVDAAREQAVVYAEQRKGDAVRAVSDIADSIRRSGDGFADQPHVKAFFDNAAEGVTELSASIAGRSVGELYDEIEVVVRRRPVVAAAAAVLAGFTLVRVLRGNGTRPIPRSRALVATDLAAERPEL